jgi:hypothetical protein
VMLCGLSAGELLLWIIGRKWPDQVQSRSRPLTVVRLWKDDPLTTITGNGLYDFTYIYAAGSVSTHRSIRKTSSFLRSYIAKFTAHFETFSPFESKFNCLFAVSKWKNAMFSLMSEHSILWGQPINPQM